MSDYSEEQIREAFKIAAPNFDDVPTVDGVLGALKQPAHYGEFLEGQLVRRSDGKIVKWCSIYARHTDSTYTALKPEEVGPRYVEAGKANKLKWALAKIIKTLDYVDNMDPAHDDKAVARAIADDALDEYESGERE